MYHRQQSYDSLVVLFQWQTHCLAVQLRKCILGSPYSKECSINLVWSKMITKMMIKMMMMTSWQLCYIFRHHCSSNYPRFSAKLPISFLSISDSSYFSCLDH